ncbi:MAG: hypothetical protein D6734_05690 [Candidatus Schekmanbacteria bacterium]|nr:MAG: hypothetical protein D6734_05690 [Candidatus Schekmanbacteria bacterium]
MKDRKGFLYALIAVDFIAFLLSWAGFLLIEEETILEVWKYILFYWNMTYNFLIGYPLQVSILLAGTYIVYYILKLFGVRID